MKSFSRRLTVIDGLVDPRQKFSANRISPLPYKFQNSLSCPVFVTLAINFAVNMCILFVYATDKPEPETFKVILAVNRDEIFTRPTRVADFWETTPDILGGRDMEPGREGGTWLAISKLGRIGCLLNVLQSRKALLSAGDRKGRGFLVKDLLMSVDIDSIEYLTNIYSKSAEYNPFSMLTVDVLGNDGSPEICYYSSSKDQKPQKLPLGIVHGVGNSFIQNPFTKVKTGKEIFATVVQEHNRVSNRDDLISGILNVMKSQEKFHPDAQMQVQAADQPETFLHGISSRFIKLPAYGTRTHTVILVDWKNRVFYQEITQEEPIDENNPKWRTSTFELELNEL